MWAWFAIGVLSAMFWLFVWVFRESIPRDLFRALVLLYAAVVLTVVSLWYGSVGVVEPIGVVSATIPTNVTVPAYVNGTQTYLTYSVNATYVTTAYRVTPYNKVASLGLLAAILFALTSIYMIMSHVMRRI